jgi:Cu-Zn family superoxide dismutase
MRLTLSVAGIALVFAAVVAAAAPTKALALLHPTQGSSVEGKATFSKAEGGVRVSVHVTGLAPGKHGFHVHEFGDCSAADGSAAGGHFNPTGEPHGAPADPQRHTGDLGNIEANAQGVADLEYVDARASFEGLTSILGRGVIVHANADDMKTQPTGNAGGRLACGVIGVAKSE